MASFEVTSTINSPSAGVFAVLLAVDDYPIWHPAIHRATKVTGSPTELGAKFQGIARPFGRLEIEPIESEEPHRLHFKFESKVAVWDYRLLLTSRGDITEVLHIYEIDPRGWCVLAALLISLLMRRALNNAMAAFEQYLKYHSG